MTKPPKRPSPQPGELWFIQSGGKGRPLIAVEIIEATPKTVLLMRLADGSAKARADALRYRVSDFKWVEQIDAG